jgi:catechol-2,3-dioxygenase
MIRLARIGHVALRVADVTRSREFYGKLLGFEIVEEDPEHGGVFMALREHGVTIVRAVDHVSQKSIYFHDPDGTLLEIYYELPQAREMFRQGRGDRDAPLVFEP